jgi:hypothetical protein
MLAEEDWQISSAIYLERIIFKLRIVWEIVF